MNKHTSWKRDAKILGSVALVFTIFLFLTVDTVHARVNDWSAIEKGDQGDHYTYIMSERFPNTYLVVYFRVEYNCMPQMSVMTSSTIPYYQSGKVTINTRIDGGQIWTTNSNRQSTDNGEWVFDHVTVLSGELLDEFIAGKIIILKTDDELTDEFSLIGSTDALAKGIQNCKKEQINEWSTDQADEWGA